jgi:hypothetical protein
MQDLNENIKIKEMYNYQTKGNTVINKDYITYKNYLTIFFKNDFNKKDKYNKEFLNGKYILIRKDEPNKKIEITPSQFINLHSHYTELNNKINNILSKFFLYIESKDNFTQSIREEFDNLKEKYILYKNKIRDIDLINDAFYKEINELNLKKIENTNNLIIRYNKKKIIYSNIKTMIPESLKSELIKIYSTNKSIPSESIKKNLAKTNNIPSNDIDLWFEWIESNYEYLLLKNEISKINEIIKLKEISYDMNTKYFIIKKPIINENN